MPATDAIVDDVMPILKPDDPIAKILLVEDDFFLGDIYQTKLSVENFDVVLAEDGLEGWEQAKKIQPDLILLDIMVLLWLFKVQVFHYSLIPLMLGLYARYIYLWWYFKTKVKSAEIKA